MIFQKKKNTTQPAPGQVQVVIIFFHAHLMNIHWKYPRCIVRTGALGAEINSPSGTHVRICLKHVQFTTNVNL